MKIRLYLLLLLVTIASAACAAPIPRELSGYRVVKLWQFGSSAEGWTADHNVSPFALSGGILSFKNTGFDPWIINNAPGIADASRGAFLAVKMRSSAEGANQVYFATKASPGLNERKEAGSTVFGDNKFRVYEVNLGALPDWKGKVTQLRLDTVNGGLEEGAKIEIDWIAVYQIPPRISLDRPRISTTPAGPQLTLRIANTGGEPLPKGALLRVNGRTTKMKSIAPRGKSIFTQLLPKRAQSVSVSLRGTGKDLIEATLQCPGQPNGDGRRILRNTSAELTFCGGKSPSSARLSAFVNGKRVPAGVFHPLATLVYVDRAGVLRYLEPKADSVVLSGGTATLKANCRVNGGLAALKWTFRLPDGSRDGEMSCVLTSSVPLNVLRFEGPRLLAGEGSFGAKKTHALFPGLEYLEAGEPNSSAVFTGRTHADRRIPHPYDITAPIMAVEANGILTGLSWDPMAKCSPGLSLPSAEFESPNMSPGAANHLMTLFAPSIPTYVDANNELAKRPYELGKGRSLRLSARFFARPGVITDVIPHFMADRGFRFFPQTVYLPRGITGTIDLSFKGFTESLYSPEEKGWRTIFGFHEDHVFRADTAARILAESLRKGQAELAIKCGIDPKAQLTQFTGSTLDWFSDDSKKAILATIAEQSADGGFPYTITDEMREKVKPAATAAGLKTDTLGRVGSTNSGLTATKLNEVLQYALTRSDKQCIDAGLKGLARLNQFTVPRGAQTWEVHAEAPDIYAAALAIQCNIAGYQLTGEQQYLEKARFWAYTGLPFVYLWTPPVETKLRTVVHYDEGGEGKNFVQTDASEFYENLERHVLPGASIPVFGTSFYAVKWFGAPVQWCGLAWAGAVRSYLRLRPDPILQTVADLVFYSGAQQQVERGFLAGSYTDVWGVETAFNSPVFLGPNSLCDYAYDLIGEKPPLNVDSYGIQIDGHRASINSYGKIGHVAFGGSGFGYQGEVNLKYYAGQDLYTCLVPVRKPEAVEADGSALAESADLRQAPSGYYYDEAHQALHVKYRPAARESAITMDWRRE